MRSPIIPIEQQREALYFSECKFGFTGELLYVLDSRRVVCLVTSPEPSATSREIARRCQRSAPSHAGNSQVST